MNAGPGGFAHAPVSKGVLLATISCTVLQTAGVRSGAGPRLPAPLQLVARALALSTPGELLFGCVLLYYFRVVEREFGSPKFGSFALSVTAISCGLQAAAASVLGLQGPPPTGPLPLIFAAFVPFCMDVPASTHFPVLGGYAVSDKAFVYLAGVQLCLTGSRRSLLALAASALAGVMWQANLLGVKRWRLPAPLARAVSRLVGPLLAVPSGPSITLVANPQAAAAAAAPRPGAGGAGAAGGWGGAEAAAARAPAVRQRRAGPASVLPSAEALASLVGMGFSQEQAASALSQTGNDVQAAIALLVG